MHVGQHGDGDDCGDYDDDCDCGVMSMVLPFFKMITIIFTQSALPPSIVKMVMMLLVMMIIVCW